MSHHHRRTTQEVQVHLRLWWQRADTHAYRWGTGNHGKGSCMPRSAAAFTHKFSLFFPHQRPQVSRQPKWRQHYLGLPVVVLERWDVSRWSYSDSDTAYVYRSRSDLRSHVLYLIYALSPCSSMFINTLFISSNYSSLVDSTTDKRTHRITGMFESFIYFSSS